MTKRRQLLTIIIVTFICLYLLWNNASRFSTLEENYEFAASRLQHYLAVELDGYSISQVSLEQDYPKKKITSLASLFSDEDIWVYNWEAQTVADSASGKIIVSASGQTTIFGQLSNGVELGSRSY